MAANALDLGTLFSAVAKNLSANQEALNQADTYNHDHGTHIVEIFQTPPRLQRRRKVQLLPSSWRTPARG